MICVLIGGLKWSLTGHLRPWQPAEYVGVWGGWGRLKAVLWKEYYGRLKGEASRRSGHQVESGSSEGRVACSEGLQAQVGPTMEIHLCPSASPISWFSAIPQCL